MQKILFTNFQLLNCANCFRILKFQIFWVILLSDHNQFMVDIYQQYKIVCLSINLSIYLFIYPSIYQSIYLSILLSIYLFIYLSIYVSFCLYIMIYPSIYLSRCPDKPCGCAGSGGELSIYCGSIKVRQISNL